MAIFFTVSRSDDQQLVLRQVEADPAKIPTEITDFIPVIDGVDRRVRRLIKDEGRRASYMAAIDGAARSAFEGGTLAAAKVALEAIKANVVEAEGPDIRKQYLHATVTLFGVVGIGALLVAGLLALLPAEMAARIPELLLKLVLTASYLLVGISLGIILLAFVRNLELRFETLGAFDAARWLASCAASPTWSWPTSCRARSTRRRPRPERRDQAFFSQRRSGDCCQ